MDARQILQFLDEQGMAVVFVVVFLEYLNLPGFPAGIILPATGVWVAYSGQNFMLAFGLSILAGLLGSIVLYAIGYIGEDLLLVKLKAKRPALGARLDRFERRLHDNAFWAVLAGKLIPVLRTLICFPAGAAKVEMKIYLAASAAGVALWNGILMAAGYFMGGQVLGL